MEYLDYKTYILLLNENFKDKKIELKGKETKILSIDPANCLYIIPFEENLNKQVPILYKLINIKRLIIQKVKMKEFMISDLILYINYQKDIMEETKGINNK